MIYFMHVNYQNGFPLQMKTLQESNLYTEHDTAALVFNPLFPVSPAGEDDDDDECGEEKLPSCFDYVMHFLTVFWKVLFAFVPPTDYWNGWACFVVSICMIGLLTAVIGTTTAEKTTFCIYDIFCILDLFFGAIA